MYTNLLGVSENSLGTLQEQHEIYLESISAYEHKLKAELQKMYSNIIDEDAIIGMNKGLTSLVETLNKLIEGFGGIKTILPMIASMMVSAFSPQVGNVLYVKVNEVSNSFKNLIQRVNDYGTALKAVTSSGSAFTPGNFRNAVYQAQDARFNEDLQNRYAQAMRQNRADLADGTINEAAYNRRIAYIEQAIERERVLATLQKEERGLINAGTQEQQKQLIEYDKEIIALKEKLKYHQEIEAQVRREIQATQQSIVTRGNGVGLDNNHNILYANAELTRNLQQMMVGEGGIKQTLYDEAYLQRFIGLLERQKSLNSQNLDVLREQVNAWGRNSNASEALVIDLNKILNTSRNINQALALAHNYSQQNADTIEEYRNTLTQVINSHESLSYEDKQLLLSRIEQRIQLQEILATQNLLNGQADQELLTRQQLIRTLQQQATIQKLTKFGGAILSGLAQASYALDTFSREGATAKEKADALFSGVANGLNAVGFAFGPIVGSLTMIGTSAVKAILKATGVFDKLVEKLKSTDEKVKDLKDSFDDLSSEINSLSDELADVNEKLERFIYLDNLRKNGGKLTAEEREELDLLSQQTEALELQKEIAEAKLELKRQEAKETYNELKNVKTNEETVSLPFLGHDRGRDFSIGGGTIEETAQELANARKELDEIANSITQQIVKGTSYDLFDGITKDYYSQWLQTLDNESQDLLRGFAQGKISREDNSELNALLLQFDAKTVTHIQSAYEQLDKLKKPLSDNLQKIVDAGQAMGEVTPEYMSTLKTQSDLLNTFAGNMVESDRVAKQAIDNLKSSLGDLGDATFLEGSDFDLDKFKVINGALSQLLNGAEPEQVIALLEKNNIKIEGSILDLEKNLTEMDKQMAGQLYQTIMRLRAFGKIGTEEFNLMTDALRDLSDVAGSSDLGVNLDKIADTYKEMVAAGSTEETKEKGINLPGFEAVANGTRENMLAYAREYYKQQQQIEKVAEYERLKRYQDEIALQERKVEESKRNYVKAIKEGNEEASAELYKSFEENVNSLNNLVTEANELYLQYTDRFVVTANSYQNAIDTIYNGGEVLTKTGKDMLQSNAEAWDAIKDLPNYEDYFYEGTYSLLMHLVEQKDQANQEVFRQILGYKDQLSQATARYEEMKKLFDSGKKSPTLELNIKQAEKDIERLQTKIDDLETKIDINVDWKETADNFEMFGDIIDNVFNIVHEKEDLVGNSLLRMTSDELYRIADIFPQLLNEYTVFIDGVMYLDKARSEAYLQNLQEELKQKALAKQESIDMDIAEIDAEIEILQASIENNAVTNAQIAHANELAAKYEIGLEGDKQSAIMTTDTIAAAAASDVATNWDKAGEYMSTSMANASASVIANLDTIGKVARNVATQISNLEDPIYTSAEVSVKSTYKSNGLPDFVNSIDEAMKSSIADITANIDGLGYEDMIAERNRLAQNAIERLQKAKAALIATKAVIGNSFSGIGQKDKTKSSSSDPTLNDIEYEQDLYHYINQELARQEHLLKQIQKKKEKLYGSQYLKALEKEQKSLKTINELNKIKLQMQKGDLEDERDALSLAYGAKFDENGLLINYNDLLYAASEKVNELAEGKDKDAYNEAKEYYDDMKDALDHYLDVFEEVYDVEEEILDRQIEILENNLEAIVKKVEFDLQPTEDTVNFLDFLNSFYENDFYKSGENLERLASKYLETYESLKVYQTGIDELQEALKRGEISTADFNEEVRNQRDAMQEALLTLSEIEEEMKHAYEDALGEAKDQLDNYTESLEHYNSQMEHFISIVDLIGEGHEYGTLSDMYGSQKENYMEQLRVQQKWYDNLKAQKDLLEETGQEGTDAWLEVINALEEVEDNIYSIAEDALGALKDSYTNLIDDVVNRLDKALTNGNKINSMLTQYERDRDLGDMYLDKPTQLYEIDSLQKDIATNMENITDKLQKDQLQGLYDELDVMRQQDKVSEYDMERMRAKYELLQAQIALEDAQQAKNQMRLTRTSQGTWEYTFTANKDEIEEAESKVNDAYNNLYQMSKEQMQDLEQQILDTVSEYEDALMQMYKDWADGKYESEEEFYRERDALINYYSTKETELFNLYNKARVDNALDAEELIKATSKETGEALVKQIEENKYQFNQAVADMADRIGGDDEDSFRNISNATLEELDDAWWKYNNDIRDISDEVGIALDDLVDKTIDLEDKSRDLASTISNDVIPALQDEIEEVIRATGAHREEAAALREKIEAYLEYLNLLNQDLTSKKDITFDENTDYAKEALLAASVGDEKAMLEALEKRFAKLDSLGIDYDETQERQNYYKYFDDITKNNNRELAMQIQKVLNSVYGTDEIWKLDEYLGKGTGSGNGAVTNKLGEQVKHIDTSLGDNYTPEVTQKIMDQALSYQAPAGRYIDTRDNFFDNSNTRNVSQVFNVEANFPNATNSNEIQDAITTLPEMASQYANRK